MEQKIFTQKTKKEVLRELRKSPDAYRSYLGLDEEWQKLFMAYCTGKKTLPVLYDTVFKKLMNPETHRDRLEDCVSSLLGRKVKIRKVLPVEDIMMDGETIMVLDILVELRDGSLVLVEIQKVPYYSSMSERFLRRHARKNSRRRFFLCDKGYFAASTQKAGMNN